MELSPVHDGRKGIGVARILLGDDPLRLVQVLLVMGMLVLAADGLDVVVPLLWKDHVVLLQEPFIVCPVEDGFLLLLDILRMGFLAEIPPVMAEPDIFAVQILPGPVKPRKLAEMGILGRDIVSGVVRRVAEGWFSLRTDLEWEINVIGWHPVGFMCSYEYLYIHEYVERRVKWEE